jgi:hypothetical protein
MGKQTSFNRKAVQYHRKQYPYSLLTHLSRKAKAHTKKINKPQVQTVTMEKTLPPKRQRREMRKLAKKEAKKAAKEERRNKLIEEDGGFEDEE